MEMSKIKIEASRRANKNRATRDKAKKHLYKTHDNAQYGTMTTRTTGRKRKRKKEREREEEKYKKSTNANRFAIRPKYSKKCNNKKSCTKKLADRARLTTAKGVDRYSENTLEQERNGTG